MARRSKKGVYCNLCHQKLTIAKKGKHKYYICPIHGVIAYNPLPLLGLVASAVAPTLIEKTKEKIFKTPPTKDKQPIEHIITDSKDKPNYSERVINKVMHDERLD